jgi:hypothetical protein
MYLTSKCLLLQNELEFLDLTNLDPNDRDKLTAILKPSAVTEGLKLPWDREENNYYAISEQIEGQEMAKVWQQYGKFNIVIFLTSSTFCNLNGLL